MSGVGISFGADRIYDVLSGLGKFPAEVKSSTKILFANMGEVAYLIPVISALRSRGLACELYTDKTKLKKQFDYAERKGIPFISINGSDEVAQGIVNIKNLESGEQKSFAKDDADGILAFVS